MRATSSSACPSAPFPPRSASPTSSHLPSPLRLTTVRRDLSLLRPLASKHARKRARSRRALADPSVRAHARPQNRERLATTLPAASCGGPSGSCRASSGTSTIITPSPWKRSPLCLASSARPTATSARCAAWSETTGGSIPSRRRPRTNAWYASAYANDAARERLAPIRSTH